MIPQNQSPAVRGFVFARHRGTGFAGLLVSPPVSEWESRHDVRSDLLES